MGSSEHVNEFSRVSRTLSSSSTSVSASATVISVNPPRDSSAVIALFRLIFPRNRERGLKVGGMIGMTSELTERTLLR